MTGYFVKAAALALAVAVLAGLLKGRQASLAAALTLGGCTALVYFAALLLQPVRSFAASLRKQRGSRKRICARCSSAPASRF